MVAGRGDDRDGRPSPSVRAARVLSADDTFFELARRGRRLSTLLVAAAVSWVFLFVARVPVLFLDDVAWWGEPPTDPAAGSLWVVVHLSVSFIPLAVLAVVWVVWVEGRPAASLPFPWTGAVRQIAAGACTGVAAIAAMAGIGALVGVVHVAPVSDRATGREAAPAVAVVLVGWIVQAGSEELVSRGWLLASLGARYGPWIGVLASSLLFASFHLLNPGFGWLPAVNLTLIGVFFALVAIWNGTLWGVLALHAAWNWTLADVFGLSVSGLTAPGGSVFGLELMGPAWLAGGEFGIEGGVPATVVACGGVLGMVMALRRRRAGTRQRCQGRRGR